MRIDLIQVENNENKGSENKIFVHVCEYLNAFVADGGNEIRLNINSLLFSHIFLC